MVGVLDFFSGFHSDAPFRAMPQNSIVTRFELQYNPSYTLQMKTAISIPDQIFSDAERTAKRLGISRSELYATAVREYVQSHVSEEVTEKLNEVYSLEESSLDSSLRSMQSSSLQREDW